MTNATPYIQPSDGSQTAAANAPMTTPKPMSDGDQMLSELLGRDPDAMPEVLRELTMLRGAVDGVHKVADELAHRLGHVLAPSVPHDSVPPTEAFSIDSAMGHHVRDTYRQVSAIEDLLGSLLARLTV